MEHVSSADGTRIAYQTLGDGPPVIIVNGAFGTAADSVALAGELARAGFRAIAFDRRARGGSGDTRPSAPEREAEDLAAVAAVAAAAAAPAPDVAVVGHSSGAVLALFAASLGVPLGRLFLSEPPFRYGENEPPADLADRLQSLVDDGRPADAVTTFQLEGIGLHAGVVEQIAASPGFDSLVGIAQSVVYDMTLTARVSTPTAAMLEVRMPVTVLSGAETFPFLRAGSERLAGLIPGAEFIEVPESVGHRLDPEATARVIATRLRAR